MWRHESGKVIREDTQKKVVRPLWGGYTPLTTKQTGKKFEKKMDYLGLGGGLARP